MVGTAVRTGCGRLAKGTDKRSNPRGAAGCSAPTHVGEGWYGYSNYGYVYNSSQILESGNWIIGVVVMLSLVDFVGHGIAS